MGYSYTTPSNDRTASILIIIGVAIVSLFIGSGITGMTTGSNYLQSTVDNLTAELLQLQGDYSSLAENMAQCDFNLNSSMIIINETRANLSLCLLNTTALTGVLEAVNTSLANAISDYILLNSSYHALAKNSAESICCILKIYNKKIDYYSVENNTILCSENTTLNALQC